MCQRNLPGGFSDTTPKDLEYHRPRGGKDSYTLLNDPRVHQLTLSTMIRPVIGYSFSTTLKRHKGMVRRGLYLQCIVSPRRQSDPGTHGSTSCRRGEKGMLALNLYISLINRHEFGHFSSSLDLLPSKQWHRVGMEKITFRWPNFRDLRWVLWPERWIY